MQFDVGLHRGSPVDELATQHSRPEDGASTLRSAWLGNTWCDSPEGLIRIRADAPSLVDQRIIRKHTRTSSTKRAGCSNAAK